MSRLFFSFGLLGLLCLPGAPRANPVDAAQALIAPMTQALVSVTPETEGLVRLRLGGDPAILSGAIWAEDGTVRYPPQDGIGHVSDQAVLDNLPALHAIMVKAGAGVWVASALDQTRLFYCQAGDRVCLVADASALAAPLGLADADAVRSALVSDPTHPAMPRTVWILLAMGLAAGLWYLRRPAKAAAPSVPVDPDAFKLADVLVSPGRLSAFRNGREIALTARDVKLLRHLAHHRGQVISKDALYDAGWGRDFMPNSRALDQHIATLRRKLDPDRAAPAVIETVHGQGYRAPA
ncbi:winged helix-turn-helix domain-containing protein [Tropicimonas sp. S265A]|uniref:winged helix-turn-helix domain-containing protein n=1 Tax=Tropicimonas sp. S265A TaxID=3415134 RepID=UPI003C7B6596